MEFDTLKEKCEYYRKAWDYKIPKQSYVLAMVDGHCFSNLIKKKFKLPFDDDFIGMMNETAIYVAQNIQGCSFAYTQSDEISFLITDFQSENSDGYFGLRLCKMQSIIASLATAKFNQLYTMYQLKHSEKIEEIELAQFDCKVWNVPNYNDALAWFVYRQNDCSRNSKQQAAQEYFPHKALIGKTADQQIDMLRTEKGIEWHYYDQGKKYGRLVYKEPEMREEVITKKNGETFTAKFERSVWKAHDADLFGGKDSIIRTLIPTRKIYLKSRYGKTSAILIEEPDGRYRATVAEEWMPIYINGDIEKGIVSIDFDGGPMISIGSTINDKTIENITFENKSFFIKFK